MKSSKYKFNSLIWVIIVGIFFLRIGTSMSIPFLSIFLHFTVGIDLSITGIIVGASYVSYTVGGFFGGVLSDRYGRRHILGASLLLYALTFFCFGLSADLIKSPLFISVTFCFLNLVAGLFRVWSETLAQAMLADVAPPNEKLAVFNLRYTVANVGNAIGPILGALIGFSGTMFGFYFTGAMCLIYFVLFMVSSKQMATTSKAHPSESVTLSGTAVILFRDKLLMYYILGGVFSQLVYVQQESTLGQILMQRFGDPHVYTLMLAVNAITVICLQIPITNYCLKKWTPLSLMKIGCLFLAGGLAGIAFAGTNYTFYIISQIIFTLGEILIFSIGGVFIDEIAPVKLRGAYFGSLSFQSLGKTIGSILGGILLQMLGGTISLCIFAIIAVGTILFYDKSSQYVVAKQDEGLTATGP